MLNIQNHARSHRSYRLRFTFIFLILTTVLLVNSINFTFASESSPSCKDGVGNAAKLQDAVNGANSNGEDDVIYLVTGCTYKLTSTLVIQPDGGHSLLIQSDGATEASISGGNSRRVIELAAGANLTLDRITVRDGSTGDYGGGIRNNQGTLTLNTSSVFGNKVTGNVGWGGGIYNGAGTVTLNGSEVVANKATDEGSGAGIFNDNGTLTLINSTISGNESTLGGGGIANQDGNINLNGSTITENLAIFGGGIANNGTLTATNSSVHKNKAEFSGNSVGFGGGIQNQRSLTLINTPVTENTTDGPGGGIYNSGTLHLQTGSHLLSNLGTTGGGGVYNTGEFNFSDGNIYNNGTLPNAHGGGIRNSTDGVVNVSKSNITFNISDEGGGVYNRGTGSITITNTTLVGNIGSVSGGNLFNHTGTLSLLNVTSTGGEANNGGFGGALYNYQGTVNLRGTILANSKTGGDCSNTDIGKINSNGLNLIEDGSCAITGLITGDPLLGEQIGFPAYLPLLAGSPAIDAGTDNLCPATDQRNAPRPQDGNGDGVIACDLGAYEADTVAVPPTETLPPMTNTPGGPTETPTNTPTPTATATLEPGVTELLKNGDFEQVDNSGKPQLDAWTVANETGDKVKCNKAGKVVAYTGNCAFRFKGTPGEQSKLTQKVGLETVLLTAGDPLTFTGWINASSPAVAGSVKLVVKYTDAALPAEKFKLDLMPTNGYQSITGHAVLKQNTVAKVKLQIKHTSTSGKVYLDSLSLKHTAKSTGNNLLPLP
jgi:hypothetical protein